MVYFTLLLTRESRRTKAAFLLLNAHTHPHTQLDLTFITLP